MAKTWNPSRLAAVWGVLPLGGYADGTMVTITPQGDGVRAITGTAGETAFIETPNRQHEVVVRMFETSPINVALTLLFEAGNVPLPLSITSLSTGAEMAAGAAKLERVPGTTYDNNVPVREWKFIVPVLGTAMVPASDEA